MESGENGELPIKPVHDRRFRAKVIDFGGMLVIGSAAYTLEESSRWDEALTEADQLVTDPDN